jgi:hypothetical protein
VDVIVVYLILTSQLPVLPWYIWVIAIVFEFGSVVFKK